MSETDDLFRTGHAPHMTNNAPKTETPTKNKSNLNWLSELIREEVGVKLSDNIFAGNDKVVNKINVKKEMAKMCKKPLGTERGALFNCANFAYLFIIYYVVCFGAWKLFSRTVCCVRQKI